MNIFERTILRAIVDNIPLGEILTGISQIGEDQADIAEQVGHGALAQTLRADAKRIGRVAGKLRAGVQQS